MYYSTLLRFYTVQYLRGRILIIVIAPLYANSTDLLFWQLTSYVYARRPRKNCCLLIEKLIVNCFEVNCVIYNYMFIQRSVQATMTFIRTAILVKFSVKIVVKFDLPLASFFSLKILLMFLYIVSTSKYLLIFFGFPFRRNTIILVYYCLALRPRCERARRQMLVSHISLLPIRYQAKVLINS